MLNKLRQIFSKRTHPIDDQGNELTDLDISRIKLNVKKSIVGDLINDKDNIDQQYEEAQQYFDEIIKSQDDDKVLARIYEKKQKDEDFYLEHKLDITQSLKKANSEFYDALDEHCDLLEKARSGIYKDIAENRKLGRVGQKYGGNGEEDNKKIKSIYGFDFNYKNNLSKNGYGYEVKNSDGEKIGIIEYHKRDNDILEIDRIYLDKNFQKRGNGQKIIHDILLNNEKIDNIILYPLDPVPWIKMEFEYINTDEVSISKDKFLKKNKNKLSNDVEKSFYSEVLGITGDFRYKKWLEDTLGRTRDTLPQIDSDNIDDVILHFQGKSPNAKVEKTKLKLSEIKFSQSEISEDKVINILRDFDPDKLTPFLVAGNKEKYLADGHHRLAALCELGDDVEVPCYVIKLEPNEAIRRLNLMKVSKREDINKSIQLSGEQSISKERLIDLFIEHINDQDIDDYLEKAEKMWSGTIDGKQVSGYWRTINGSHVLVNKQGKVVAGAEGKLSEKKSDKKQKKQTEKFNKDFTPQNKEEFAQYQQYLNEQSKQAYSLEKKVAAKHGGSIRTKEAKQQLANLLEENNVMSDSEIKEQRKKLKEIESDIYGKSGNSDLKKRFDRIKNVHEDIERSMGVVQKARGAKAFERFPLLKRDDIPDEQAATLFNYTGGGYMPVNRELLSGKVSEEVREYESLLNETLDKLPDHQGEVYRSTQSWKDLDEIMNEFQQAKQEGVMQFDSFISTSQDENAATNNFPGDIKYKITSKSGKDVSGLSDFPGEQEVLFKSGSKFKVKKIKAEKQKFNPGKGKIIGLEVGLEEI